MRERDYQARLIKKLHRLFPGCVILKNDSEYVQGIPDLLILFKDKWGMLEVKSSKDSEVQPNQEYYVSLLSDMSFASFIWPDVEEEVLSALQRTFQSRRSARLSERF